MVCIVAISWSYSFIFEQKETDYIFLRILTISSLSELLERDV